MGRGPNVYDTTYVNSGPGVGYSSGSSSYSGVEGGSKTIDSGDSGSVRLAQSIANAAQTSPAAQYIRDQYYNPSTSAYSAELFNDFMSNFGTSFDMDEYYDKVMDINKYNNQWSADQAQKAMNFENQQAQKAMNFSSQQAQKQMDYQTMANKLAMQWSAEEAHKSRKWTEMMSNTAHKREVKDLMAAGLNPILAANNGAYSGSGATGQAFAGSGASGSGVKGNSSMGQTDMSVTPAFASMMSGLVNTARDLAVTKINADNQRYMTDMSYASAKLAAGASIYNNNNTVSAQKAMNALNRDADIQKANIAASASRDAAATSAGAMTSAAATNAAAAKYSADKHLAATKYSSDKSYESTLYSSSSNFSTDPIGYVESRVVPITKKIADKFSDIDNVYTPDLGTWNTMGAE